MSESDAIRLRHMVEAATEALRIAGGRPMEEILRDRIATLAAMKDLEIIGEAASKVSADLRTRTSLGCRVPGLDRVVRDPAGRLGRRSMICVRGE